jgi:peroxiredoxin
MNSKMILTLLLGLLGASVASAEDYGAIAKVGDVPFPITGTDINGIPISVPSLKGKVVVLYFFTTQPGAGMTELMLIQRDMWPRFNASGLVIIGIGREAGKAELESVAQSLKIRFPLLPDPNKELYLHFASKGHPRLYLLDRSGHIELTSLGYSDDELDRINAAIDREFKYDLLPPHH